MELFTSSQTLNEPPWFHLQIPSDVLRPFTLAISLFGSRLYPASVAALKAAAETRCILQQTGHDETVQQPGTVIDSVSGLSVTDEFIVSATVAASRVGERTEQAAIQTLPPSLCLLQEDERKGERDEWKLICISEAAKINAANDLKRASVNSSLLLFAEGIK